jgi:hypothetical protein
MRLLEELEKIRRNSIPKEIVRAMFETAVIGGHLNKDKILQETSKQ